MSKTLEELIEICGDDFGDLELRGGKNQEEERIWKLPEEAWRVSTHSYQKGIRFFSGKTPREAIEKLVTYLEDAKKNK